MTSYVTRCKYDANQAVILANMYVPYCLTSSNLHFSVKFTRSVPQLKCKATGSMFSAMSEASWVLIASSYALRYRDRASLMGSLFTAEHSAAAISSDNHHPGDDICILMICRLAYSLRAWIFYRICIVLASAAFCTADSASSQCKSSRSTSL